MITRLSSNRIVWLFAIVIYLWKYLMFVTLFSTLIYVLHDYLEIASIGLKGAIPLGILGTALSLFLSFRNNSAYDRWWEARKIWGGIVNSSRTFGIQVLTYISDRHIKASDTKLKLVQKELIYRHIAYINALRLALRNQKDLYNKELSNYLSKDELQLMLKSSNIPTQINFLQSQHLKVILKDNLIEDFKLYELMHTLETFYDLQGKAERIKNTPFPMYYDFFIQVFMFIFIAFLPISLIGILNDIGGSTNVNWLVIPISLVISFMFIVIEQTGFFTETPFENKNEDVALSAICRTIEIDLREMINDTNIPQPIQTKKILIDGEVLM